MASTTTAMEGTTPASVRKVTKEEASESQLTIYAAAKRTLDARNRSVIRQRNILLGLVMALAAIAATLAIATLRMAGESRLVPYVIRTDVQGRILDATVMTPKSLSEDFSSERVIEGELAQWVEDWRYVTQDVAATRTIGVRTLSMVAKHSPAETWVMDWYRGHDPVARARNVHVDAKVRNVIPQSLTTYEVYWSERETGLNTQMVTVTRWRTVIEIVLNPPKNGADVSKNRYGIFIKNVQEPQREAGE